MNKLKELREQLGMSRAEMAKTFEIPYRTLENWERGTNIPPAWAKKLLVEKLEDMIKKQSNDKI